MVTIMSAAPLDGAAALPDTLIEQYVKPDGVDQAALIGAFRLTALQWVEKHTRRSLQRRAWIAMFDGFTDGIGLTADPVRSVDRIDYVDPAGTTIDAVGLWQLVGSIVLPVNGSQWPVTATRAGSVTVFFDAGYDDLATEAPALQIAALMLVKHLFDGGSVNDVPVTVNMLLDTQYRTPVMG